MTSNRKVIYIIIVAIFILGSFYAFKKYHTPRNAPSNNPTTSSPSPTIEQTSNVQVISTNPDPLDNTIIATNQTIEITFSNPLENTGEFKHRIEPTTEYTLKLSSDRKTIGIVPTKPYALGTTFTLFISPETKFDGGAKLANEKQYHFRTVDFRSF